MPTQEQVQTALTMGWSLFSYLNDRDIEKLKDGCTNCTNKDAKCLYFLLTGLQFRYDEDVYDDVTESLYTKIATMTGNTAVPSSVIYWGYFDVDPFGSIYPDLVFQFSQNQSGLPITMSLNFTQDSYLKYVVMKENIVNPVRSKWKNTDNNFGIIPDAIFREPIVSGDYRYYISRQPFVLDQSNSLIQFEV